MARFTKRLDRERYARERALGATMADSARAAGSTAPYEAANYLEREPDMAERIEKWRDKIRTRGMSGVAAAVDRAASIAESGPNTTERTVRDVLDAGHYLAKVTGAYAPERHELNVVVTLPRISHFGEQLRMIEAAAAKPPALPPPTPVIEAPK